ncbi:MAG: DUF3737 family protein [Muribaculaceae bacterium]|nr:DUF3737 family protein [Bacteroides sp.]MDE6071818.1 DUF3737 family protein [Muribaculaceae bacterium]
METIKDKEFGGERPLFGARNLRLENVTIHAGESALKCCANIEADNCRFEGKYPFWHVDGFKLTNCEFTPGARAALWYSRNCEMSDTQIDAPKMFREMDGIRLRNVNIPDAEETLWHCDNVDIKNVKVEKADYLFMHSRNIRIEDWEQHGNYSFQYCTNVEIRNAKIHSKDAFWGTENVTVYDSELDGEYLGWHSKRLHLVRCKISGTQPLCYCRDLILEDCEFAPDCDLAFEDSEVTARVLSPITSIKNPAKGKIEAKSFGDIIIDEHSKAKDPVELHEI